MGAAHIPACSLGWQEGPGGVFLSEWLQGVQDRAVSPFTLLFCSFSSILNNVKAAVIHN